MQVIPKNSEFVKEELSGKNVEKYELRIVIWNTRGVPFQEGETYVNIRVRCAMNDGKQDVVHVSILNNICSGQILTMVQKMEMENLIGVLLFPFLFQIMRQQSHSKYLTKHFLVKEH